MNSHIFEPSLTPEQKKVLDELTEKYRKETSDRAIKSFAAGGSTIAKMLLQDYIPLIKDAKDDETKEAEFDKMVDFLKKSATLKQHFENMR